MFTFDKTKLEKDTIIERDESFAECLVEENEYYQSMLVEFIEEQKEMQEEIAHYKERIKHMALISAD